MHKIQYMHAYVIKHLPLASHSKCNIAKQISVGMLYSYLYH